MFNVLLVAIYFLKCVVTRCSWYRKWMKGGLGAVNSISGPGPQSLGAAVNKLDKLLHLLYCRKYLSFLAVIDFMFQSLFLRTAREGNVFRSVCQSFCPRGFCLQGKESVSGGGLPPGLRGSAQAPPPVLASSDGHCSSQCVSYCDAFF